MLNWFYLTVFSATILIIVLSYSVKKTFKNTTPIKKFILFAEQNNYCINQILEEVKSTGVFKLISEFRPQYFAKLFRLHNQIDIDQKYKYIDKFDAKLLKTLVLFTDYATLKSLCDKNCQHKLPFILDIVCKNRFKEFIPLIRSFDEYFPDSEKMYKLFNLIDEYPDIMKFVKYFDNKLLIIKRLNKDFWKQYSCWFTEERGEDYIYELAIKHSVIKSMEEFNDFDYYEGEL